MIQRSFLIEPNQETRIRRALHNRKGCRIKVKKASGGNGELLVTPGHLVKYEKAPHGSVIGLPFKHTDLQKNMEHKGGFLPLLLAALAPIIGGVAGGLIEKEIAGSGLYKQQQMYGYRPGLSPGIVKSSKHYYPGAGLFTPRLGKPRRPFSGRGLKKGKGMRLNPWMGSVNSM